MKRFDVITIFPEVIGPYAKASILGRAQKAKLLKIRAHNLRKYTEDKHRKVDDTPYGGGPGMLMSVQPFDAAIKKVAKRGIFRKPDVRVVLTSASGKRFTQEDARRLSKYDQVIFLCGRYEGVDQRVEDVLVDEALSIGDFVLTGGELPALVMIDAIARHLPGVLGNEETLDQESHSNDGLLEYPQYTKPEVYVYKNRKTGEEEYLQVPEELLSGHHERIATWRREHARKP